MPDVGVPQTVSKWNWRIHVYLGLYMLLFLWLFAVSGWLMNHPRPHQPHRSKSEHQLHLTQTTSPAETAAFVRQELGLEGEILLNRLQPNPDAFFFRVHRPGRVWNVNLNLKTAVATVVVAYWDNSSMLEQLHTFSGVRPLWAEVEPPIRDWLPTRVWSFVLDAVSVGVVLQVLSSLFMWVQLREKRRTGLLALALGVVSCLFFLQGLRWL